MAGSSGLDFYAEFNQDYVLTPSGSIQTAVGWDRIRQRIERRLITNSHQQLPDKTYTAADYIFAPSFGLGVGAMIDQNPTKSFTAAYIGRVNQAISREYGVDPGVAPQVTFAQPNQYTWLITAVVPMLGGTEGEIQITSTSNGS